MLERHGRESGLEGCPVENIDSQKLFPPPGGVFATLDTTRAVLCAQHRLMHQYTPTWQYLKLP